MKVFICKFFEEEGIEHRLASLIARERKRGADNMKVICVDEQIQKRLETAGINSEIYLDFLWRPDIEDQADWEMAYQLSDELRISAENNDSFKYSGINFLAFEHNIWGYIFWGVKLSKLCQQMAEQNCETLVLVLTKSYSLGSARINSQNIRTITYIRPLLRLRIIAGRIHYMLLRAFSLLKVLTGLILSFIKGLTRKNNIISAQIAEERRFNALFVVSTPLYARPALAICNKCIKNGIVPYVAPYDSNIARIFQSSHNIGYANKIRLLSAMSLVMNAGRVIRLTAKLKKHVRSHYDLEKNSEMSEFSADYLSSRVLLNELQALCFEASYHIIYFEKYITTLSPAIISLMPDGHFPQQMAAAVAKKHSIPTLACSAALETGDAPSHMKHLYADKIAAMGEVIRDIYIKSGLEPERIVVTGVAHFDRLYTRDKERDKLILMEHGIDPNKRIIVFGTENLSVSETVEALRGVIEAVLKMKDSQLVVKVHPGESIEPYQAAAEKYHDLRIHVVKDIDLYALLSRCELLIIKYSTIALEAMMIDKPVIVINLSGQPTPVPYAEEGAAPGVYRYEDIEPAILEILYNEETRARFKAGRDRFVRAWAGEPDGKASQRIVNLMKEMIKTHKIGKGVYAS